MIDHPGIVAHNAADFGKSKDNARRADVLEQSRTGSSKGADIRCVRVRVAARARNVEIAKG